METKLAVVVSDIHCGSDVGLAPPCTKTKSGNHIEFGANKIQAWLWDKWLEATRDVWRIIGKSKDAVLIVNGDATEGSHHRNSPELLADDILVHTEMARECLAPLSKACQKRFVVKGTQCHTLDMEHELARLLGAESGKAKDKWLLSINGCLIDAAHHMPVTGRVHLEASAMSIMMGNARLNYLRSGHQVPKVFLRAHRHCGGYYSDGDGLFAVTGAWQCLTRHGHAKVTDAIPRPSILVLDWRGKKTGALPAVHHIGFNPPPHEKITT